MSNIKLGVEVASAHDLMPKDVQGSASPFVELHLDHQKIRTTVKEKDLNPCWNETFYFNISDHDDLTDLTLDAYVYNNAKGGNISNPNSFMGKVHINGTSFVPYSDAVVFHYPLQKLNIVSRVKGELRLKVFIVDDFSLRSSNPISQMETSSNHHLPNPTFQQQQSHFPSQQPYMAQQPQGTQYAYDDIRNRNQIQSQSQSQAEVVRTNSGSSSQHFENPINETSPVLGSGHIIRGRVVNSDNMRTSTYDVVEPMQILFVRVVKAKDLPTMDVTGRLDPYVEVRIGNYKESTQHFSKTLNPEWNTVFAFSKERMQASILDVMVKDKDMIEDDFLGIVRVNLHDIPARFPWDIPLAPEWYRLEEKKGAKRKAELMFAVWFGTQADEAFPDAFLLDAAMSNVDSSSSMYTRSKVYHSPRLWYVRVNIIEIQDLVLAKKTRFPYVRVKAQINNQVSRTRPVQVRAASASWNEDMMFVAAEPFEDHLILTIEDRVGPDKDEVLGKVFIPLNSIEMRPDDRIINSRWFDLQDLGDNEIDGMKKKKEQLATRLQLRVCLDGGYHVLTELTQYSSDVRPTAKELWKPSIGILELGILNASALQPMKTRGGKGTVDAYCVAKYGHEWLRTQTVVDSLAPQFNEQYTWEVYDPSTILTVGVFDNAQLKNGSSKDTRIGRIRIRISTLDLGRVYTHSYPLLVLHPTGVKKMGELNLAIRFSNTSIISTMNMMLMYSKPLLPKMHYLWPLTIVQLEMLRNQAIGMVADQLGKEEPPLGREIVEYMMDVNSHVWSVRRSKSIFSRLMLLFDGAFVFSKWFKQVCSWKYGITSVFAHILLAMLVSSPCIIPQIFCMYMISFVINQLRLRGQYTPHMNTGLLYVDNVDPDELNEGFDSFQASRSPELVRHSYDRLRSASKQIQSFVEDIVSLAEQVNWLLTWRDPRATSIFLGVLFLAVFVLSVIPFQVLVIVSGFYVMRHPRFRHRVPSASLNFLGRMPDHTDSML